MKKNNKKSWKQFLKKLGPGIVTGASDDDPSGIATYSQAGANFGLATLWMALITLPLMISIQEMCARIGLVTSEGLITNIKKHYPKALLYLILLLSLPAIVLNIASDLMGMGAAANLIFPQISIFVFSIFFLFFYLLLLFSFHILTLFQF